MAVQNLSGGQTMAFTPMESAFKYIYEQGMSPDEALSVLQSDENLRSLLEPGSPYETAVRNILSHLKETDLLRDDVFFSSTDDVRLNIHPRYMPLFRHKNQFFVLQYVVHGTLNETVAGQELCFHAGDICFVAPETELALKVYDDETIVVNIMIKRETFQSVFINLLYKEDVISDFFTRVFLRSSYYPYMYCRTDMEKELSAIVRVMIEVSNSQMRFRNRLMVNKLEELFIRLLERYEYNFVTATTLGETDKKILPILRYIQENFRTVTLAEVAKYFNYSEAYLSHLISQYSGNGFSQIVKTARMRNAAKLLSSSELSIEEISAECGYDDRSYFHKTFRKQYGITPNEYRRQHAQK